MAYRVTTTVPLSNLFVADEQRHRVVDLPEISYIEVSGLDEVATAAGLRFHEAKVNLDRGFEKRYGSEQTVDLAKARLAAAERHSVPHLFGRGRSSPLGDVTSGRR